MEETCHSSQGQMWQRAIGASAFVPDVELNGCFWQPDSLYMTLSPDSEHAVINCLLLVFITIEHRRLEVVVTACLQSRAAQDGGTEVRCSSAGRLHVADRRLQHIAHQIPGPNTLTEELMDLILTVANAGYAMRRRLRYRQPEDFRATRPPDTPDVRGRVRLLVGCVHIVPSPTISSAIKWCSISASRNP